ncbi:RIP metalloprotease RseP, partial [Acinetobacter baumannii]|nr:RIP metalloprotease RseP [Acinetobacter baumannii]
MIAAAALLLGPLIAIHEFGHYWVARKLGVKVLVYSIGFGPTLLKWTSKKSGIKYQLSALPLGMIAAAALLLGPLIAIHEFGHYWVARKLGVKVLVYSIGFGPTLLKWTSKKSGIKYQLSALPLGGYVKMLDEREGNVAEQDLPYAFNRQKPWKRIAIVAAGPLINLIFAVLLFWILFLPAQEQLNTKIGKIIPNSPAAAAQLHVGDKIIAVDGKETTTWEKLNFALIDRVGETGTVNIDVDRAGSEKNFVLPIKDFLKNQNESALDVLGFLPYRPVIPAVVTELTEDGAAIRQGMKVG